MSWWVKGIPKTEDSLGQGTSVEIWEVQIQRRSLVSSHSECCKTESGECSGWLVSQGFSEEIAKLYTIKSQS